MLIFFITEEPDKKNNKRAYVMERYHFDDVNMCACMYFLFLWDMFDMKRYKVIYIDWLIIFNLTIEVYIQMVFYSRLKLNVEKKKKQV